MTLHAVKSNRLRLEILFPRVVKIVVYSWFGMNVKPGYEIKYSDYFDSDYSMLHVASYEQSIADARSM